MRTADPPPPVILIHSDDFALVDWLLAAADVGDESLSARAPNLSRQATRRAAEQRTLVLDQHPTGGQPVRGAESEGLLWCQRA